MQTALRVRTTIRSDGRIVISHPRFSSGEAVDVIVLLPENGSAARRSVVDILAETPGHRVFRTAAEVDAYLREERESWGR
ncbi:MAG: hypothetical protein HY784_03600 [Chloroflexi bacterium]|nr:hypothetical protein [Chloroflexota bacterium]